MKKLLSGLSVLFMLFVIGCGGGGSSSDDGGVSANPTPIGYDLRTFIDKSFFRAEGTVDDVDILVTYFSEYIGSEDYLGTPLDMHLNELSLTYPGGVTFETSYTGTYLGNIYTIEGPSRNCEIVDGHTPTPVPTDATIGYVSDIVPLSCTDGVTMVVYFELQDGGDNTALLVSTSKTYINGETLVVESISKIDTDLNLLAYEMQIGNDIHFEATSITQY
ncbi:MAG: hypothetical protein WBM70_08530 [Sulfurovum sp.]|uniref:hypothetical protein n=1 Tax=Sulfurovum sp. TaxID=1969726 RepID=UPI003C727C93